MGEDYADEIERLKVEIVKKQAEFKLAEAEHAAAAANVSIHTRLNQRKPGMIAQEDLIKGESERPAPPRECRSGERNSRIPKSG